MSRPVTGFAYLDALLETPGTVLALAHRGGAGVPGLEGLENTAVAFRSAYALGYRYLETDVHLSADGRLIAFHDDVLDRVTDGVGQVAAVTTAVLDAARIGGAEPIPMMADLLEEFGDCRFNIDLKSVGAGAALADLVDATGSHDRVCVGSFSLARMREFRRRTGGRVATTATPAEVVAHLLAATPSLARWATGGVPVLQVPHRRGPVPVVTASFVHRVHAAGAHLHVWTIDDADEIAELIGLGVDGIFTDRPDVLRDVLTARGLWRDPS
ncbi:MAG: ugpQ 2 [Marmoricola sp.]|nr:ugpQ 2 [Marmoricola sp.]